MLAETKKPGLTIHEVEIDTVYLNGNKSSHFQPIRSSLPIYKVFLKFALPGLASFGLDMGLFASGYGKMMHLKCIDSGNNYCKGHFRYYSINRKKVFEEVDEMSFLKYMILAGLIMALSAGMVHGLFFLTGKGEMIIKVIVDSELLLAGFCYSTGMGIQKEKAKTRLMCFGLFNDR